MNGDGAVPESGVKKGDVGLNGPGENEDGAVSVNVVLSELVLADWKGCRKPMKLSGLLCFKFSWLGA